MSLSNNLKQLMVRHGNMSVLNDEASTPLVPDEVIEAVLLEARIKF